MRERERAKVRKGKEKRGGGGKEGAVAKMVKMLHVMNVRKLEVSFKAHYLSPIVW